MTIVFYLGMFVVASLLVTLVSQPSMRRRQWAEFNVKVRELDSRARANGWALEFVNFRPGWLFGTGDIWWRRREEAWSMRVRVSGERPW